MTGDKEGGGGGGGAHMGCLAEGAHPEIKLLSGR